MTIRRLDVRNFRGIRELTWRPAVGVNCLIGPGNSTKTTVLDAIALVLSPRFNVALTDADFHACDIGETLEVAAYLTNLPGDMLTLDRFGDMTCGLQADGTVLADPEDGSEVCLAVRFTADASLEPSWEVFKPGTEMVGRISAGARAELGLFRVDERVDNHMRWARGSALTSLTAGSRAAGDVVAGAYRSARQAVFDESHSDLSLAAKAVKDGATSFGAGPYRDLRAGLDPSGLTNGVNLVLHDGMVPLTSQGLGARRLTSMAIQHAKPGDHALVLVDEVEAGLEPHRLHRLLRKLSNDAEAGTSQVIITTHSSLVVEALPAECLAVVRSVDGTTHITSVPADLGGAEQPTIQGTIRKGPSAMLASRVLVGEGATELGVLRAFSAFWDRSATEPLAIVGAVVKDGKSDREALISARQLAVLGYPTAVLIDSDQPLTEEAEAARAAGVEVIQWADEMCLEQRVAQDLPAVGLRALVELAVELNGGEDAVRDAVQARLPAALQAPRLIGCDPLGWVDSGRTLETVRGAVGLTAHKKGWFKTETKGEQLGNLLLNHHEALATTDFGLKMRQVRAFMFAERQVADAVRS
ncbi:ATP-binding protein [Amycolatopsis sp., V23-08]|uniref:ATP-binding protein n=1 Tax=Amycolatopsis heterodermiae TaxID=3110235 RepID=A0ABU5RB06_9PSEU|nr:ATP-binding protein [Amycolatopsis sp., V23-08]MEA5362800.1 ATP-binding protein [Amycolatopsis sp., V23-08]